MKRAIMTLAIIMMAATSLQAMAGDDNTRKGKGDKYRGDPIARLTDALELSDEQAVDVATILEDSRAQHRAIQESVEDEHCAVRENTYNELASILTEEQMARFEQMESKRKSHGRRQGMPRFANCEI